MTPDNGASGAELVSAAAAPAPLAVLEAPALGPAELYIASLASPVSRRTAVEALRRMTRILTGDQALDAWRAVPWERLTAKETTLIQSVLVGRGDSRATIALTRSMLRGVLHQAWRLGLMPAEQYQRAIDLKRIPGKRSKKAGRMLTPEEVAKLAAYCRSVPPPLGTMLGALYAIALGGGLRREELATLRAGALQPDGQHLLVLGKGNKERLQPIPSWVRARVDAWLAERSRLKLECGRFFIRSLTRDTPFTAKQIWQVIIKTGAAAGVAHFTPHDLRRTFGSRMIEEKDLSVAQQLMGHENATTTVLYDRRAAKVAEEAVAGMDGWGWETWKEEMTEDETTKIETTMHPVTGQSLVDRRAAQEFKRRVVKRPDFTKGGAPCDVAWLRTQARRLEAKQRSPISIAAALNAVGVRHGDGQRITLEDVNRWLA